MSYEQPLTEKGLSAEVQSRLCFGGSSSGCEQEAVFLVAPTPNLWLSVVKKYGAFIVDVFFYI